LEGPIVDREVVTVATSEGQAKERGGAVLSVRFSPEELERLKNEAERAGEPVSAYVRRFALSRPEVGQYVTTRTSNVATNPDATVDAQIVGYAGVYTPEIGTNV
jgi:hypothetical protein